MSYSQANLEVVSAEKKIGSTPGWSFLVGKVLTEPYPYDDSEEDLIERKELIVILGSEECLDDFDSVLVSDTETILKEKPF